MEDASPFPGDPGVPAVPEYKTFFPENGNPEKRKRTPVILHQKSCGGILPPGVSDGLPREMRRGPFHGVERLGAFRQRFAHYDRDVRSERVFPRWNNPYFIGEPHWRNSSIFLAALARSFSLTRFPCMDQIFVSSTKRQMVPSSFSLMEEGEDEAPFPPDGNTALPASLDDVFHSFGQWSGHASPGST